MSLTFHFNDWPISSSNPSTGQVLDGGSYGGILGLGTQYNGEIAMNGRYAFLEIVFRPTGFYKIFRLPSKDVNDFIVFTDDLFDPGVRLFYERLCMSENLHAIGVLADAWLLGYLQKQK
ncbi:MAG: hypothetical protein INR73_03835 [Williamsia sp.]|nr:hypothetical protein [Williamsia sp.]